MRRRVPTLLVLAVALLVAGCGGSSRLSKPDYQKRLRALNAEVTKALNATQQQVLHASSIVQLKTGLTSFADTAQRLGDEAAKLKAPKDAEAANGRLAKALHELAQEARGAIAKLAGVTSPQQALGVLAGLRSGKGLEDLGFALTDLQQKGYSAKAPG